jgi:hypothetical protein
VAVEPELIEAWLDLGLQQAWVEQGIRRFEDYLVVHAAFAAEWPENE